MGILIKEHFKSGRVMVSFRSDWREVFVISNSYGMGDSLFFPLRRSGKNSGGGRYHPSITV